ncbi:MAG TPA: hypothetical protein VI603_10540 [Saprospiraceae bacterium]|nr:hypothetical protein [Saprospiraceae bacterium]
MSLTYLILHAVTDRHRGKFVQLNNNQIEVIASIYTDTVGSIERLSSDSLKRVRQLDSLDKADSIRLIYLNQYLNSIGILDTITAENEPYFFKEINKRYYVAQSYFWLKDNWIYWELILFALLGVLCNSLYHLSENVRKGSYDKREAIVYYAKLFYAPVVTLILYLAFELFSGKDNSHATPVNTIVLSFVLGFFSGRSIELLDRIKNVLFPTSSNNEKAGDKTDYTSEGERNFMESEIEKQEQIINEYIVTNAQNLKEKYPEIQGLSARRKKKQGLEHEFLSLHFELDRKIENIAADKAIPVLLLYNYEGKEYEIPTDTTGVGDNDIQWTNEESVVPKQLGMGCSLIEHKAFGTIGLKVRRKDKLYLLSCYHVLCPAEFKKGQSEFPGGTDSKVISPGEIHRKKEPQIIGHVTEGRFDNFIDAAIAELTEDGKSLINQYFDNNGVPKGIRVVSAKDAKARILVKLVGKTSKLQLGNLVHHYQKVTFFPKSPAGLDRLFDLIVTSKISDKGDSGATVVDASNNVIGMLVGGNDNHSYVIPINTILNRMNLTIDT